ncbi:MAG TPA: rRNA pseudouridine synthase [Treponema sp.]|nr:rRNA pseudouridine synthase [Treponema sp.]
MSGEKKPYVIRLDDYFIQNGMSTYRAVRKFLRNNNVLINGNVVIDSGYPLNTKEDELFVNGEKILLHSHLYLMMNKKQNTLCTSAPTERETVFSTIEESLLHPEGLPPLHTAGRLDRDTEGLLLLTTDGKLSHKLTDPETHITKTYLVNLRDSVDCNRQLKYKEIFASGTLHLPPEKKGAAFTARAADLEWDESSEDGKICRLTLTEGKFHQVKRMFRAVGNEVVFLKRIAMGSLHLDDSIPSGEFRPLTDEEISILL